MTANAGEPVGAVVPTALPALQGHQGEELYTLAFPEEEVIGAFMNGLLSRKREWLQAVVERSTSYRPLIASLLEERGMPRELAFLPAVESGFNPKAVSPAGAAGLWQLMANTSVPLGLRTDDWVDERRDIWKSTEAALAKLQDDRERFGSWEMALAAYNCGAARLAAIARERRTLDYWELRRRGALPIETASFVPQFLALARILSYPGRHGLEVNWQPYPEWQRVPVDRTIDLRLLAREAGIGFEELAAGNPELVLPLTPPASYRYQLKVPVDHVEEVERALARGTLPLMEYTVHVVSQGDTLWDIAKRYRVSLELLEESNPEVNPNVLRLGSRLLVPLLTKGGGG